MQNLIRLRNPTKIDEKEDDNFREKIVVFLWSISANCDIMKEQTEEEILSNVWKSGYGEGSICSLYNMSCFGIINRMMCRNILRGRKQEEL